MGDSFMIEYLLLIYIYTHIHIYIHMFPKKTSLRYVLSG